MHNPSDTEMMDAEKVNNPARWCEIVRTRLDKMILAYNEEAEKFDDQPVIVAFAMTKEEREDYLNDIEKASNEE